MKYTIQDHGPECFGLYQEGKRIAVLAECCEATAESIAEKLNDLESTGKKLGEAVRSLAEHRAEIKELKREGQP